MSEARGPVTQGPRRWWIETWRAYVHGDRRGLTTVVWEAEAWWENVPFRDPQPSQRGSVGLSGPDGTRRWLEHLWETPSRHIHPQGRQCKRG